MSALLLLFALLLGPPPIDGAALEARVDAIVTEHLERSGVPGVVVAVTVGDEVLILRGWGLAEVEGERPMDPERSLVRVASLSKTFTATAVAQLEDRGLVDVDADVDEFLARLRTFDEDIPEPVTLRQLLAHTSGFINYNTGRVSLAAPKPEDFEAFLADTMPPRMRPPGVATLYTNHGNALAGMVVQDVSGQPFADYVEAEILAPLAMEDTTYDLDPGHPQLAASYRVGEDQSRARQRYEHFQTIPASALHSTAADMANYLIMHAGDGSFRGQEVLSPAAMERMRTPSPTIHPALPEYHYAFAPTRIAGREARVHGGSVPAYLSRMAVFDEHEVGVFVAQNAFGPNVCGPVLEAVAEALPRPRPDPPIAGDGRPEQPEQLVGAYRSLDKHETAAFTRARAVLSQAPLRVELDGAGFLRVDGRRFVALPDQPRVFEHRDLDTGNRSVLVFTPAKGKPAWVHLDRRSAYRVPWHGQRVVQIGLHALALLLLLAGVIALPGSKPELPRALWIGLGLAALIGWLGPQIFALIADADQPVYTHPLRLGLPIWLAALSWLPRLSALAGLFLIARGPQSKAAWTTLAGLWLLVALELYWRTPSPGLDLIAG